MMRVLTFTAIMHLIDEIRQTTMNRKNRKNFLGRFILGLVILGGTLWIIGISLSGAADFMYLEEQQWTREPADQMIMEETK